ncbi:MAG TPA: hypothetical protein VMQ44_00840 [Candidatus Saccharimonadales bacterium]|nr:hypothetical protein [Candidatus Saccharimonadales bacterium]
MKSKVAKIISGVFSPYVVIPIFGVLAIAALSWHDHFILWSLLFLILTVATPVVYVLVSYKRGKISDIHVAVKEQREKPFIVSTLGAAVLFITYYYFVPQLAHLAEALVLSGVVFALVTKYWKVSVHAAAFTGGVMIVSFVWGNPNWLWPLLLLPVIIWARVVRERHNVAQSIAAAVLVGLCVFLTVPRSF